MLNLITLGAIALQLNFPDRSLFNFREISLINELTNVKILYWQQAKGEPYQSPYEREATGDSGDTESDVEEIRRRSYEQRREGYEDDYRDDDDYRRDRSREYEEYNEYDDYSRHRRRQILEEQKERIEEELEALDGR